MLRVFFFCEMRWGGFAFCSSCSKVSTHSCVRWEGGCMREGRISEVGTQAWSYFAYLYWHVQVDFLCPKMSAIHRQQTETESNKERERERGAEGERNSVCVFVCMSRLSKGSKTVDITMIIRLISYISYMCMHEYVWMCVSVNVSKWVWVRLWVCVCVSVIVCMLLLC